MKAFEHGPGQGTFFVFAMLYVIVDSVGPVGAFTNAAAAQAAVSQYTKSHWRAAIFSWDSAAGEGDAVHYLMQRDTAATVPLRVGTRAEVLEAHKILEDSLLGGGAEDIDFRQSVVGALVPAAERRIRQTLAAVAGTGITEKNLDRFIELTRAQAGIDDAPTRAVTALPVANFVSWGACEAVPAKNASGASL